MKKKPCDFHAARGQERVCRAGFPSKQLDLQKLSKAVRGLSIKVFEDPITHQKMEGIGIVRAVHVPPWCDPGYFVARVQFDDGVFERTVHIGDLCGDIPANLY